MQCGRTVRDVRLSHGGSPLPPTPWTFPSNIMFLMQVMQVRDVFQLPLPRLHTAMSIAPLSPSRFSRSSVEYQVLSQRSRAAICGPTWSCQ